MKYGLLGKSLSHSFSPQIHKQLGSYSYQLFEREKEDIGDLLKESEVGGFNITIPYKSEIMKYCTKISQEAQKLECVNTLLKSEGEVIGYNTDYRGFIYMVNKSGINPQGKKVIILGAGATSKTVEVALKDLGAAEVVKLCRKCKYNFNQGERFSDFQIVVNCTPVGMYPNNLETLIDLSIFTELEGVLDLIYNPHRSGLIFHAMKRNIAYSDGLPMLVAQAKYAAEIFTKSKIDDAIIGKIESNLRRNMENIVLVGMPGCGKSTLGKILAQLMDREFIDLDFEIEKKYGSIPQIFKEKGEEYFRALETKQCAIEGKKSGVVISTGGGIVKDFENYKHLKQNAAIVFVKRDMDKLETAGRPLSQGGLEDLKRLYEERVDLYEKFSDFSVENVNINKAVAEIRGKFYENLSN